MDKRMKERRGLEMDLRQALSNGEFELHYQPLVNLQTNEITAFEALLRWNHPAKGLISPADFVPIAEETGLIVSIGEWVLRVACKETANWPAHVKVAVNLSPAQLKSKNLMTIVMSALEDSGMRAERLQLEITETMLMQNTFATLGTLHQLRKLGVQIAMDDFGTGYSSLSYLRSFPFDKIKIDRSFIADLSNGAEPRAIVHAVAGLAKCLNMISTAEGVETLTAAGYAAGRGLHRNAGLSVQPRPAGRRGDAAVCVAPHQGGERLARRQNLTSKIRVRSSRQHREREGEGPVRNPSGGPAPHSRVTARRCPWPRRIRGALRPAGRNDGGIP